MELCRRRHNSKERRLDPQITIGLLTDATGFPLAVEAFEGNKAETATMLPVINAFKTAHQLTDVTVVADAGMISEANQIALQASGLSFILGTRIPLVPDVVRQWRDKHPDEAIADGHVFTQPWPATSGEKAPGKRCSRPLSRALRNAARFWAAGTALPISPVIRRSPMQSPAPCRARAPRPRR